MGQSFVKIRTDTWERLRDLQQVHNLDVFGQTARQDAENRFEIQGLLSSEQVEQMRALGYEVEITADADQVAAERLREVGQDNNQA